jgi:glycosyltransferase involved in cell wall biosynthesis
MRLLFLCKRDYMRKDVIADRYGRLYELPAHLSRHHQVRVIATRYRPTLATRRRQSIDDTSTNPAWYSPQLHWLLLPALVDYWRLIRRVFREQPPDVVIGGSDALHVILTSLVVRIYRVPVILDLYDNFEAFGLSRIPGVKILYRRALARADAVTCVSRSLQDYIGKSCRGHKPVVTIESTINPDDFYPMDKHTARRALGLDIHATYIGTAGALFANRGIGTVYAAFLRLLKARPDVKLLLAGALDPGLPPPDHDNVIYLGDRPHADMKDFYNALDIAFNYMNDDDFGRYSFPQKAYEMLACRIPVLSARVGVFADLLAQDRFLYSPGDDNELQEKILALLADPVVPVLRIPSWAEQAERMNAVINGLFAPGIESA